jgi:hypothetical protein
MGNTASWLSVAYEWGGEEQLLAACRSGSEHRCFRLRGERSFSGTRFEL